jgi:hypothetical protein
MTGQTSFRKRSAKKSPLHSHIVAMSSNNLDRNIRWVPISPGFDVVPLCADFVLLLWFKTSTTEEFLLFELECKITSESDFRRARIEGHESATCRSIVFRMTFLSSVGSYPQ